MKIKYKNNLEFPLLASAKASGPTLDFFGSGHRKLPKLFFLLILGTILLFSLVSADVISINSRGNKNW